MLKAVAFDLWETLITNTPAVSRQQHELRLQRMKETLEARGYGSLIDRVEKAHHATWDRCQTLYWSADRDVPCRRQIEHFLEEMDLDPMSFDEAILAELEHAYANVAVEIPPVMIEGAPEMLRELKSRGFGVGLISNTGRTPGYALREILAGHGLAHFIDAMIFSNEHGHCKPQPSIFEELRRSLGVRYDEMMFVGDNLYVDVHGAQRCGMKGVHFSPKEKGTAVAPEVEHGLEIRADATIGSLRDVVTVIERMRMKASQEFRMKN